MTGMRETIAFAVGGPYADPKDARGLVTGALELLINDVEHLSVQLHEAIKTDVEYLQAVGVTGRLKALREICSEMTIAWPESEEAG